MIFLTILPFLPLTGAHAQKTWWAHVHKHVFTNMPKPKHVCCVFYVLVTLRFDLPLNTLDTRTTKELWSLTVIAGRVMNVCSSLHSVSCQRQGFPADSLVEQLLQENNPKSTFWSHKLVRAAGVYFCVRNSNLRGYFAVPAKPSQKYVLES